MREIGLGAMALGVARSLLRAGGFRTHACDVRKDVLDAFAAEGGVAQPTPAALARECEAVVVPVVSADQAEVGRG